MSAAGQSGAERRRAEAVRLRDAYLAGDGVGDLVASTGLSHGTVINRLRSVGTPMRTPAESRRLCQAKDRGRLAAALKARYESGARVEALAAEAGRSLRTVRRLLVEAGTVLRTASETRRLAGADGHAARRRKAEYLRSRYDAGERVPVLAAEIGASTSTVYRLLHAAGTAMRPRHRPSQRPPPPSRA